MRCARLLFVFVLVITFCRGIAPAQQTVAAEPKDSTYTRYADGLWGRRVFVTASPKNDYQVEVWRFSVPPRTKSAEVVLSGAAALVVHLGSVTVVRDNKRQTLRLGESLLLADGERVAFVNESDRPANLRAVIIVSEVKP